MDWQQIAALAIVGATAFLFLRKRLAPKRFDLKRDTPCGCSGNEAGPKPTVSLSGRKGQPARWSVRTS